MDIGNNLNYKVVCEFDVKAIAEELMFLGEDAWNIDQSRQKRFYHHKETKNIIISDIEASWRGYGYPMEKFFVSETLNLLTDRIVEDLESRLNGKAGKCIYINLPANKDVITHRDHGYYLTGVHRCHIPIVTNDLVDFFLNGEIINMKTGVCYEINNFNEHGVSNKSDFDRIHLLVDIIPLSLFK